MRHAVRLSPTGRMCCRLHESALINHRTGRRTAHTAEGGLTVGLSPNSSASRIRRNALRALLLCKATPFELHRGQP